jgi:two-component system invasion response regulator UvrY
MLEVLIVDDHPAIRAGVRNLLRNEASIRVAAEAETAAAALEQTAARNFDVVLLDLSLPDGNGLDLIPILRQRCPALRVIVFTNHDDAMPECIASGASGFLSKDAGADEIKEAIEAVAGGRTYVSSRATRPANGTFRQQQQPPHLLLSRRELEVMLRLVRGQRPKEIGLALGISEKTIATHRARLMTKLNVADNRSLLMYALRTGLTDWA